MLERLLALALDTGRGTPAGLDLTDNDHLALAAALAADLQDAAAGPDHLRALEAELVVRGDQVPLLVHLAVKMALSRSLVSGMPGPAHLSVVFAVYREHERMLPGDQVAGGEDFLRRKAEQLDWLCCGRDDLTWDMLVVDDGCPAGSGDLARRIVAAEGLDHRIEVLFLAEAIAAGSPVLADLADTTQSMKGGAVQLGMWSAVRRPRPNQVVVFTDADLSTHLGQTGLLVDPILRGGADAAIGSRRLPASVVVKQGARNTRGKLFIYLWKRIIPVLPGIIDTQCGFKAFRGEVVGDLVSGTLEKKFAFDIELLVRTTLRRAGAVTQVPIAWIDSDVLSTTTDLQPYLPMLKAMVAMSRRYLPGQGAGTGFAAFIDELDEAAWGRLQENIPQAIADGDPADFGEFSGVTVEELRTAAGGGGRRK